jgi:N-acyl-D-aspartate/D-glutamate deacylase
MDHIDRKPKAINMIQLVPVTPLVSYVMGGWNEDKARQPNDKEMAEIVRVLHEAMACGAGGWAAQRLTGYGASVQRDYDGTLMVSDLMGDEFYLNLAKALGTYDRGTIQFAQVSGALDEGVEGPRRDMQFAGRLAELSNRPTLFNAVLVTDERPQVFRTMLGVVDDCNKRGVPLVAHGLTMRLDFRFSLEEQWNLFDNVDAWREATLGTPEERKAKLVRSDLRQAMRAEYDRTKQPKALGDIAEFVCRKITNEELRKKYRDRRVGDIAKEENKHVIDVLIDISAADNWKTEWLTPVRNQSPEYCRELLSHRTVAGFSDGGTYQVPDFGCVRDRPLDLDGTRHRNDHPRTGALSSELLAGVGRGVQGSRLPQRRDGRRYFGVRSRQTGSEADGGSLRRAAQQLAAGARGRRVSVDHGEWSSHV